MVEMLSPVPLAPIDIAALGLLIVAWLAIGLAIELSHGRFASVSVLMASYRRDWMRHTITRDPRVFDAMIVTSLRDGTAFFASACMIAIGGALALMGNVEQLTGIATEFAVERSPRVVWEIKLLVTVLFVTNAFLKFVWANRIYGYCSVMMGALPNDTTDPETLRRADQAAELNIAGARAFNRGLRSIYFALCSLTWLLGAAALMVATLFTLAVLLRREFASKSRRVLARTNAKESSP